ncbi:MAG: MarR family transcriptional regulator, partial [Clostridia bacterium]|nr:MarR family transcriptional regulator [Clostridia bacterium]
MEERFKTFTLLMNGINRSIHKLKTAEMAEYQLKSSHVSCLYYLYKEEMTAKDLCDICNEDKANISRAVKYLEENGFLESKAKTQTKY